jgi:hypothetical protein
VSQRLPSFADCFRFPVSTPQARRDLLIGGTLLFALVIGWILNLGHRLEVVHRVVHEQPPYFRGFAPWGRTFTRGLAALCAIAVYLSPAAALTFLAAAASDPGHGLVDLIRAPAAFAPGGTSAVLLALAAGAFVLALYVLPGGMTYNAAYRDIRYLYRPDKALRRALRGGRAYAHAWLIALSAIALSLLGLVALGVGFLYTSVWAWSVVGVAFSRALVLADPQRPPPQA